MGVPPMVRDYITAQRPRDPTFEPYSSDQLRGFHGLCELDQGSHPASTRIPPSYALNLVGVAIQEVHFSDGRVNPRNPPGRGRLAVFPPPRRIGPYGSRYERLTASPARTALKNSQLTCGDIIIIGETVH
jgi:hypothetical protein